MIILDSMTDNWTDNRNYLNKEQIKNNNPNIVPTYSFIIYTYIT